MGCQRVIVCLFVIVSAALLLLSDVTCLKPYRYENPIVQDLHSKKKRDEALTQLLASVDASDVTVNYVKKCPQPGNDSPPLVAVFHTSSYDAKKGFTPGEPRGHVVVFDTHGKVVFRDVIENKLVDVNGDGVLEIIRVAPITASYAGFQRGSTASALSIQQLTPKRELLLRTAYTCGWSYRFKGRENGAKIIEVGIFGDDETPQVVFTWSKADHRYLGETEGYDDCCKILTLEAREEIDTF
jgi:hypothetical protein